MPQRVLLVDDDARLVTALQTQLKDAAEKSVDAAVAAHTERVQREAMQRMEAERAEGVAALRAEWSRERDRLLADARMQVDSQLVEVERRRWTDFDQRIESQLQLAVEKLQSLSGNIGENAGQVRASIEQLQRSSEEAVAGELQRWQQLMDQRTAEAQARFAELEQATKKLGDRIAAEASTAEAGWRDLLEADLASASRQWNEKIEATLEEAASRFAERLARNGEVSSRQLDEQLQQKVGAFGSAFSQVTANAESALAGLRASISNEIATGQSTIVQLQQSLEQFETRKEGIAEIIHTASQELARRGELLLEAQGVEMNRQADAAVAGMAERLQPALEGTGRQTIERLGNELEERLAPQIARATELMSKFAFDQAQAEKSLQEHQTRLWQASERSVQDSVTHSKEILAQVEKEFSETARNASAKWFNELEAKATETTHATFESLFKSADWYEKKVQTQMQSTLEKGVDQATSGLREKAREIRRRRRVRTAHQLVERGYLPQLENWREQRRLLSGILRAQHGADRGATDPLARAFVGNGQSPPTRTRGVALGIPSVGDRSCPGDHNHPWAATERCIQRGLKITDYLGTAADDLRHHARDCVANFRPPGSG